jgi:hypothetical protein
MNGREMRRLGMSRRQLFETVERPLMQALPQDDYEYAEWHLARVGIDYHVEVQGFLYSVPHSLIREQVDIRARLMDCRRRWWTTRQTTCLANQWAVAPAARDIKLCSERTREAKQIADASYDPATERLRVPRCTLSSRACSTSPSPGSG